MSRLDLWYRLFWVESVRSLARHKFRSILTTLGITIGVAAVIWADAIGEAGTIQAREAFARLGDALVWIEAGSRNVNGLRSGAHVAITLTPEDAEAIRREVPLVKAVAENLDGSVQVITGERNWGTSYRGVGADYAAIRSWKVAEGTFFGQEQVEATASVAVLGHSLRRQLFGDGPALGQVVRVHGFPFQVIGVLAPKGQSGGGRDQDDVIVVPWTAAQRKLRGGTAVWLDDIMCSAVSFEAVNPAIDRISALLRQRHHLASGGEDDFNIRRPDEVMKAQIDASTTLELLLVTLAGIALLVGGVGVMNVMLASVVQRTTEIGVRIAVGATSLAVQVQFLGEAVLLGLAGGLLGLGMSCGRRPGGGQPPGLADCRRAGRGPPGDRVLGRSGGGVRVLSRLASLPARPIAALRGE